MSSEELAQQAADQVRELVAGAERRAEEIVREAEAEAARIRKDAEADARERLERARRALSEPAGETAEVPDPTPSPTPEPPVPGPDPMPPPTPQPGPDPTPYPRSENGGSAANGDAAARLEAMKLALEGSGREEIAVALDSKFGASDRSELLDDVLVRVGK